MFKIKPLLLFVTFLYSTLNYGQFTDVINSNRPGESMAAFSVGKTVFQTEFGVYGGKEKNDGQKYNADFLGSDLNFRYGALFEQLEFNVNLEYQYEKYSAVYNYYRNGIKKTTLGAKFLVYDPVRNYEEQPNLYSWKANHKFNFRQFIPAIGIYGGVNINFSHDIFSRPTIPKDANYSLKGMLITQNQFGKYTFLTNIILDKFPSVNKSIDYVVTLTRGFNPRWSGFLETQGFNGVYYKDNLIRGGAAYLVKQNVQVDVSLGKNFKSTPELFFGGIGVSWRFDANYNEVFLRIPKEEKGNDKDKKSKKDKKDKAKKRLDEVEGEKSPAK